MQLKWPMRWDLFSLFPAYAGVIPPSLSKHLVIQPFPRIRGGDPLLVGQRIKQRDFSPHTRG